MPLSTTRLAWTVGRSASDLVVASQKQPQLFVLRITYRNLFLLIKTTPHLLASRPTYHNQFPLTRSTPPSMGQGNLLYHTSPIRAYNVPGSHKAKRRNGNSKMTPSYLLQVHCSLRAKWSISVLMRPEQFREGLWRTCS